MSNPIPGWYPDPAGSPQLRWWDGGQWTDQFQPDPGAQAPSSAPGGFPGDAGSQKNGNAGTAQGYSPMASGAPSGYPGNVGAQGYGASATNSASGNVGTAQGHSPMASSAPSGYPGNVGAQGYGASATNSASGNAGPRGTFNASTATNRYPLGTRPNAPAKPSGPKTTTGQIITSIVLVCLTLAFGVGALIGTKSYVSHNKEYKQAQQELNQAKEDLQSIQESSK